MLPSAHDAVTSQYGGGVMGSVTVASDKPSSEPFVGYSRD
jgi:hypothetical protein